MRLSVVIPIYNAAPFIEKNLVSLIRQLDSLNCEYEILLCDDFSRDNSRAVLEKVFKQYQNIICFYNQQNHGLGHTLRFLFTKAKGEVVIYLDMDLPFGVAVINRLLEAVQRGGDVVVASRYKGGKHPMPLRRRVLSRLYYLLCRALFNIPVRDIGSGAIALRRQVIEKLELKQKRFTAHIEVFLNSHRQGFLIHELDMAHSTQQPGSFSVLRHGQQVVRDTLQLWMDLKQKN